MEVARFKNVTTLFVGRGKSVTPAAIAKLKNLTELETLVLRFDSGIDDEGFRAIGGLSGQLNNLGTTGASNLTGAGLSALPRLTKLVWANFRNTKVTSAMVRNLAAIPNLRGRIHFQDCVVEVDAIVEFARLQKLHRLSFIDSQVSTEDIVFLQAFMPNTEVDAFPEFP
jgi:hypothetical protein